MASSGGPSEFRRLALNERTNRERRRGGLAWFFGWNKDGSGSLFRKLSRPASIILLILAFIYSCAPKAQQWLAAHGGIGASQRLVFEKRGPLPTPDARPAPAPLPAASPAGSVQITPKAVYGAAQNRVEFKAAPRAGYVPANAANVAIKDSPPILLQPARSQEAPKAEKTNVTYFRRQLTLAHGWLHSFGSPAGSSFGVAKLGNQRPLHAVPRGFIGQGSTQAPGQEGAQTSVAANNGAVGRNWQGPGAAGSFSRGAVPGISDGSGGPGLAAGRSPCGDFKNQYAKNLFRGSATDQTPCSAYNNLASVDAAVAAQSGGLDAASQMQAQVWDGSAANSKHVSSGAVPQIADRGQPPIGGAAQAVLGDDSKSVVGGALDGAPLVGDDAGLPGTNRPPAANPGIVPKGVTASGLMLYGNKYLYGIFY